MPETIAKVTIHQVKEGRMAEAKKQVYDNTASAKKEGFLVGRYLMLSRNDPNRMTTVTVINDKQKFDKWAEAAMARATTGDSAFLSIDTDEYNVEDLMK